MPIYLLRWSELYMYLSFNVYTSTGGRTQVLTILKYETEKMYSSVSQPGENVQCNNKIGDNKIRNFLNLEK